MEQEINLSDPQIREMLESPGNQLYVAYPPKDCANCGKKVYFPGSYWQLQIFKLNKQADLNKLTKKDLVLAIHVCEQCFKLIPEQAFSKLIITPGVYCANMVQQDEHGEFKDLFVLPEAIKKVLPKVMQGLDP